VYQLAQTLGSPVVLENLAHEVVAAEVPPAVEEELFAQWEARSRRAHRADGDGWLIVPVEARGIRWGHLLAMPGPPHAAGRTSVLEQGAIALALGRLADGEIDEWSRIGQRRLVDGLLAGRYAGIGPAAARLEAAGLPLQGSRIIGMVASGAQVAPGSADAAARALGGRALVGSAPSAVALPAATILASLPLRADFGDAAANTFAASLARGAERILLTVGTPGE